MNNFTIKAITHALIGLTLSTGLFANQDTEKKETLKIEYPEPLVKGTEIPKGIPNMEKARVKGSNPAAFLIPKGCENVAEGKYVTGSDEDPSEGDLDMIVDGDADGNGDVDANDLLMVIGDWVRASSCAASAFWCLSCTFSSSLKNKISRNRPQS